MKKRLFKFGAALTAALMMFSATASLAFADEVDAVDPETTAPITESETIDEAAPDEDAAEEEPAEDAEAPEEEAPAEDVEEVVVPVETEEITAEDVIEAEAEAAAVIPDVATDSEIAIGEITSAEQDNYFKVSVPFEVKAEQAPTQMSLFVYNVTSLLESGDVNNATGFKSETETPVAYIDQYNGSANGTYTFSLSKDAYKVGDVLVVKIGGNNGITKPDAKSYTITGGGEITVTPGDVDGNGVVDGADANHAVLIWKNAFDYATQTTLTKEQADQAANVNGDDVVDGADANEIVLLWKQG